MNNVEDSPWREPRQDVARHEDRSEERSEELAAAHDESAAVLRTLA